MRDLPEYLNTTRPDYAMNYAAAVAMSEGSEKGLGY